TRPTLFPYTTLFRSDTNLPGVGGGAVGDGTTNSASVGLNLTIPIYQGGRVSAQVRQSKESLGQARIEVDVARDSVRRAVTAAWRSEEHTSELQSREN